MKKNNTIVLFLMIIYLSSCQSFDLKNQSYIEEVKEGTKGDINFDIKNLESYCKESNITNYNKCSALGEKGLKGLFKERRRSQWGIKRVNLVENGLALVNPTRLDLDAYVRAERSFSDYYEMFFWRQVFKNKKIIKDKVFFEQLKKELKNYTQNSLKYDWPYIYIRSFASKLFHLGGEFYQVPENQLKKLEDILLKVEEKEMKLYESNNSTYDKCIKSDNCLEVQKHLKEMWNLSNVLRKKTIDWIKTSGVFTY